jgi:hypothetical protein
MYEEHKLPRAGLYRFGRCRKEPIKKLGDPERGVPNQVQLWFLQEGVYLESGIKNEDSSDDEQKNL